MFVRSAICGFCGRKQTEKQHGDGFDGWIGITGLHNDQNPLMCDPHFCPECVKNLILPFLNFHELKTERIE